MTFSKEPHLHNKQIIMERYVVREEIGAGGMGTVYLVEDLRLEGKKWALKEVQLDQHLSETSVDEAQILAQLSHPYLPQIVDYSAPDREGYTYLVMDYIQGKTLQDVVDQRNFDLSIEWTIQVAIQVAEVLIYLHHTKPTAIIYRDLKPANIMIVKNIRDCAHEQPVIKLIDFGVARKFKQGQMADTTSLGTAGFAAPEQFENKQSDERTDIFCLGAMLYYLFSRGHYVYSNDGTLLDRRKDLPLELHRIVKRMTHPKPEQRYQRMQDVRLALCNIFALVSSESAKEATLFEGDNFVRDDSPLTLYGYSFHQNVHHLGPLHKSIGKPIGNPDMQKEDLKKIWFRSL